MSINSSYKKIEISPCIRLRSFSRDGLLNLPFQLERSDSGVEWRNLLGLDECQLLLIITQRFLHAFTYAHLVDMVYSTTISTGKERYRSTMENLLDLYVA